MIVWPRTIPPHSFKFANYITVVGQIYNNDEMKHKKKIENLMSWCQDNHLALNISKAKELIVDQRKRGGELKPVLSNGTADELINHSSRFLGIQYQQQPKSPHADVVI